MEFNRLNKEILAFCKELSEEECRKLPFKKPVFIGIENAALVEQASLYKQAKSKIPTWWERGDLVFPDRIALEQASSQMLASWKKTILPQSIDVLVDACAGLGVDSCFLGKDIPNLLLFEPNPGRADAIEHNLSFLRNQPFNLIRSEFSTASLENLLFSEKEILVYADPDRRTQTGQRLAHWKETMPSVQDLYHFLKEKKTTLLVKFSPMDDVAEILAHLSGASQIWTVSISNEVKEVLFLWQFGQPFSCSRYLAVDLNKSGAAQVEIPAKSEKLIQFSVPEPGMFLLDPWAAIRKGNQSVFLAQQRGWNILSSEARLFCSVSEPIDFPGRVFIIVKVMDSVSSFAKGLKSKSLHVVSRNFPQSADDIKKKYQWEEKGDQYLFCYQNASGQKVVLLTERMENLYSPTFRNPISQEH